MAAFQLLLISFNILVTTIYGTDLVCNNTHLCSNQVIDCTNSATPCNIHCTSRESCKNTTILCANNENCTTICSSNLACHWINIQCPNPTTQTVSPHCTINGTAPNALTNMNFKCNAQNANQQCNILCLGHSTCSKALIDGRNNFGPLNILCSGDNGCTDMTLYCPQNQNDSKLCTVSGWKVVGSGFDTVHENLNIFATNSWNDIDLSHYIAWVRPNSSMHCGVEYENECSITNAAKVLQWNCINNTSPCSFVDDTVTNKRCDDDYSCNGTSITCSGNKPCNVWCTGKHSCSQSTVHCADNYECNIICSGEGACDSTQTNTVFHCPSDANCNVACGVIDIGYTNYGLHACSNAIIHCATNPGHECNVNVYGDSALQNAQIQCNKADKCNIFCNGLAGCQRTMFDGADSQLLKVKCAQTTQQPNTCSDMKVICPLYDVENDNKKQCILQSEGTMDDHHELELFCRNSWNDIDILNYSSSILPGSVSRMNCGYDDYNNSCLLTEGTLVTNSCFCDFVIPNTTTTTLPPEQDNAGPIVIISVSIACFFCVLFMLFGVLWMKKDDDIIAYEIYCEKQRLQKKVENAQYEKVENQDDEKVELPTSSHPQ